MKKEKKSILPGAALAALVAAVIVYCIMLNAEKNIMNAYEKGSVVVAIKDLEEGMVLTEENMEDYLAEKEMDKKLIPEKAFTQKGMLYQYILTQKIDKGAMITASMVTDVKQIEEDMREPVVAGFKADDLYQVVSGVLRSGDRIHIYTVDQETKETYLIWEDVFVKEVFDSSGTVISADDRVTAVQRVNILLEKDNVEQFYSELAAGSLRVVRVME